MFSPLRPFFLLVLLIGAGRSLAIDAVCAHTVFYYLEHASGTYKAGLEAYWQINPRSIHYSTTHEKAIIARIKTDVVFYNDSGILKEDHYILQTPPRTDVNELARHSILELKKYRLPAGFVHMRLSLTDLADTTNKLKLNDTFTIVPPPAGVFYSDIQLLDTIILSAAASPFLKNGAQRIPACANFLDEYKHNLHYYADNYRLETISKADYPLIQKVFISKNEDEVYGRFIKNDTIKYGADLPVSGTFNINSLPSGNYNLKLTLETKAHLELASRSLFFQRLNKHPEPVAADTAKKAPVSDTGMEKVTVLNLKKTFIARYSLGEIKGILKMLLPFSDGTATQTIRNFLKKPDELYMRYYVYNYFSAINSKDPGKAFKEFSEKIIDVNQRFNARGVPGYETDRGFIYLRYGAPTDVITVQNENGSRPYEIWQYNVLTQTNRKEITDALFLFYKPAEGDSDFKILHSTVEGEARNMNWRTYLYTVPTENSRAEEYIGNK